MTARTTLIVKERAAFGPTIAELGAGHTAAESLKDSHPLNLMVLGVVLC